MPLEADAHHGLENLLADGAAGGHLCKRLHAHLVHLLLKLHLARDGERNEITQLVGDILLRGGDAGAVLLGGGHLLVVLLLNQFNGLQVPLLNTAKEIAGIRDAEVLPVELEDGVGGTRFLATTTLVEDAALRKPHLEDILALQRNYAVCHVCIFGVKKCGIGGLPPHAHLYRGMNYGVVSPPLHTINFPVYIS